MSFPKQLLFIFFCFLNIETSVSQSVCAFRSYQSFDLCLNTNSGSQISKNMNHVIDKILNPMGLKRKNFIVKNCTNVQNAFATIYKDIRYIVMDEQYFRSEYDNYLVAYYLILAHEIAHHLNGHTIERNNFDPIKSQQKELECDYFAGVALANLGFSLKDILKEAENLLYDPSYNKNSTHPSLSRRLSAISDGFTITKNAKDEYTKKVFNFIKEDYDKSFQKNLENRITYLYNEAREKLEYIASNNSSVDLDDLINEYLAIEFLYPNTAFIKADLGNLHFRNKNFSAAYNYYLSAYKLNNNKEYLINMYNICFEGGLAIDVSLFKPLEKYDYTTLRHPNKFKFLAIYFSESSSEKNPQKSIEILNYALKHWNKFDLFDWEYNLKPNLYSDLSLFYLRKKNYIQAYSAINKAYQIYDIENRIFDDLSDFDKNDIGTIINNKALIEMRLEKWNSCIKTSNLIISFFPENKHYTNGSIDYYLGKCYLETENISNAKIYLTQSIDKSSTTDYLYYFRGIAHLKDGNHQKALIDFTIACDKGFVTACEELKKIKL